MRVVTLVSYLWFLVLVTFSNSNGICIEREKEALLQFKHDLKDDMRRLSSWVAEEDCCKWIGIVCDNSTDGHVLAIRLRGPDDEESSRYKLGGNINPSLLNLTQLKYLDLSRNDFEGIQIPSFIGSLTKLRYLNLSQSGFDGMVPPQLGNLTMLRYLSLGYAPWLSVLQLSVKNLQWLSGLSSLHHLDMGGVYLGEASDWLYVTNTLPSLVELYLTSCELTYIPHLEHVNFTSLAIIDLSFNSFHSPIPMWISSLSSLRHLMMTESDFNSDIPNSLYNCSLLKTLSLGANNLEGIISSAIGNLTSLVSLNLEHNNLRGRIPDSLGNMTSLVSIDLTYNQLTGSIPNSLGNLCNLKEIDLSKNSLEGRVNEVFKSFQECSLNKLEVLSFGDNHISGYIPVELGQFINLVTLSLRSNVIFGPIPASIGRLSSLKVLDVSHNQLNGTLPESLGQLVNLEALRIQHNLIKGVVSEVHFYNLTRLGWLFVHDNALTLKPSGNWVPPFQLIYATFSSCHLGTQFPSWLQSQRNMILLDISNTGIVDTLPTWFWSIFNNPIFLNISHNQIQGNVPSLLDYSYQVDLSSNHFKGPLPRISSDAVFLDLSDNFFSGSLQNFLCDKVGKQKGLKVLNLANNLLVGGLPDCWANWKSLSIINFANNSLTGNIPSSMGYLYSLQSLNMRKNNISGKLHPDLMKLTKLSFVDLAENKFNGSISEWKWGRLMELKALILRSNKFTGDIPYELCHHNSIQILDLAHNNFSGNIPTCFNNFSAMAAKESSGSSFAFYPYVIANIYPGPVLDYTLLVMKGVPLEYQTILKWVTSLDLSSNNLSGGIPDELMSLVGLRSLNLSENHLTGRIPEKIGEMKQLESLDFSSNQLFGEIPLSMSSLTFLSRLNLSYNNLIGKIPSGTQLQTLDESSFIGNRLCGPPLIEICDKDGVNPNFENRGKEIEDIHEVDWFFVIGMIMGFIVSFWAVLGPLLANMSWRIAYFYFLDNMWYKIIDVICKCRFKTINN